MGRLYDPALHATCPACGTPTEDVLVPAHALTCPYRDGHDVAQGDEVCDSCRLGLEQGERYRPVFIGIVQAPGRDRNDPQYEVRCLRCAPAGQLLIGASA